MEGALAAVPVNFGEVRLLRAALAQLRNPGRHEPESSAGLSPAAAPAEEANSPRGDRGASVHPITFGLGALGTNRAFDLSPVLEATGFDPPGTNAPRAAYQALLDFSGEAGEGAAGGQGGIQPFQASFWRDFAVAPGAQYVAFTFTGEVQKLAGAQHFANAVIIGKINKNGSVDADHFRTPAELGETVFYGNPAFLNNGAFIRICVTKESPGPDASIHDILVYPTHAQYELPPERLSGVLRTPILSIRPLSAEAYWVITSHSPGNSSISDGQLYFVYYDASRGGFVASNAIPPESALYDPDSLRDAKLELFDSGIAWIRLANQGLIRLPLQGGVSESRAERGPSVEGGAPIFLRLPSSGDALRLAVVSRPLNGDSPEGGFDQSAYRGPKRELVWNYSWEERERLGPIRDYALVQNALGLVAIRQKNLVRIIDLEHGGVIIGEWWGRDGLPSLEGIRRVQNGFYLELVGSRDAPLFFGLGFSAPVALPGDASLAPIFQGFGPNLHYRVEQLPGKLPRLNLMPFQTLAP